MIKKLLKILKIKGKNNDLAYWLSKSPHERVEAVEILRRQFNESAERFQRTITVIQQT